MNNRIAIITVAGISSRFNDGISEKDKVLKCLFSEGDYKETLLFNLVDKVRDYKKIIVVGGYKFDALNLFYNSFLKVDFPNVILVMNEHFGDLSSGYSLFLGIEEAVKYEPAEILFLEGDLDMDSDSVEVIKTSKKTVLTTNPEPISSDKSVVLYRDGSGHYKYAFSRNHGLLEISEPFSSIYNSGQVWKFTNIEALKKANDEFVRLYREETNLSIVQRYLDEIDQETIEIVPFKCWTNCNTREDYLKIVNGWRA